MIQRIIPAIGAAFIVGAIIWLAIAAPQSLWIDELLTWWVIKDGPLEALIRSISFPAIVPIYYLIESTWTVFIKPEEWQLRILSQISLALTCWIIFRWSQRRFSTEHGILIVLCYLGYESVLRAGTFARPYSLGLLFAAVSLVQFDKFIRREGSLYAPLLWCLFATLTHFFFILLFPIYAIVFIVTGQSLHSLKLGNTKFLILFLLILFLIPQIVMLVDQRIILASAPLPEFKDIVLSFAPWSKSTPLYLVGALTIFIGFFVLIRNLRASSNLNPTILLATVVLILPPVICYISTISGITSIFLPRYYVLSTLGGAVVIGSLLPKVLPITVSITFSGMMLFVTLYLAPRNIFYLEDWRGAIRNLKPEEPLIIFPGIVELKDNSKLSAPRYREYLKAPLLYYETQSEPIVVSYPGQFNSEIIKNLERFALICRNEVVGNHEACAGFKSKFQNIGLIESESIDFGALKLKRFNR